MTGGSAERPPASRRLRILSAFRLLCRYGAIPLGWRLLHRAGPRSNRRRVHEVVLRPGGRRLVIKSFDDPGSAPREFARQTAIARRYPGTVAPLLHSRTGRFVVMPRVTGHPAFEAIARPELRDGFAQAVAWLRALHERAPEARPATTLSARFDVLIRGPRLEAVPGFHDAARHWREVARDHDDAPAGPLHGDFHPGNVLLVPDGFRILDVEDAHVGPRVLDVAQLLAHMHLMVYLHDRGAVGRTWPEWRDRILGWYGAPDLAADPALGAAMQLRRLHMTRFTLTGPKGPARDRRLAFLTSEIGLPPPPRR